MRRMRVPPVYNLVGKMFIIALTNYWRMSVISVRVDKRLKEILKKAGVDVSKEVKHLLEELAWSVELRERLEKLEHSLSRVAPAQQGFSAKIVREDRESH